MIFVSSIRALLLAESSSRNLVNEGGKIFHTAAVTDELEKLKQQSGSCIRGAAWLATWQPARARWVLLPDFSELLADL